MKLSSESKHIAKGIVTAVITLCLFAILAYFLFEIRVVFIYILIAAIIALMARPMVNLLHDRLKLPSTLSSILSILLFVCLIAGFFALVVPLIIQQGEIISNLNFNQFFTKVNADLQELNQFLLSKNITILDGYLRTNLLEYIDFGAISNSFSDLLSMLGNFTFGSFAVLFISFYFLKEKNLFNNMVLALVPSENEQRTLYSITKIKNLLSRYFLGILLQVLIMFVLYFSVLNLAVGVEYDAAILIAFICALCNVVPYVGPIVGFVIFVVLAISNLSVQGLDFDETIMPKIYWLIGGYVLAQVVDNFFNQPLIYSKSVKSHPLEIFLVLIIGGLLGGVLGVILAVPFYTILRVILKEFYSDVKWVKSITKNI